MFGVKFGLNRHRFVGKRSSELFQSISQDSVGCLDGCGEWIEGAALHRDVSHLGRLRLFRDEHILENRAIVSGD
jgi:hypothetical protein